MLLPGGLCSCQLPAPPEAQAQHSAWGTGELSETEQQAAGLLPQHLTDAPTCTSPSQPAPKASFCSCDCQDLP